jgi:beta-glucosidase
MVRAAVLPRSPSRVPRRPAALALAASVVMAATLAGVASADPEPSSASGATLELASAGACGDAVERRIDDLLREMSLAEKVEQMSGIGFLDSAWRTAANTRLGIPGLAMLDGPRGVSLMAGPATSFPVAMARGASWDPALEERVGEAIGEEAHAKGASVLLAPTINLLRHPRWGRAQETYGEDTYHLGRMGVGFVRGAQRHVVASAKHYAVNSIEDTRLVVDVLVDERTLREVYLPHFRAVVQEGGVGSVMAAYNQVNGWYCAENVHLLRDILKNDWGFRGFVESDWFVATQSTERSLVAGLDIEMPVPVYYGAPLLDAAERGELPLDLLDDAVRRILRVKFCFGVSDALPEPPAPRVQSPEHLDLALEAARKSIVLLQNEAGALPLDRSALSSIVVVGDLATTPSLGDLGSSVVEPSFAIPPFDGIQALAGDVAVTHVAGPPLPVDGRAAIAAADAAIVIAGLTAEDEGEGSRTSGDRVGLGLPGGQDELIAAVAALNPRTVVVLEGGSALTMPWANDVAAIVMAWYPGQLGGQAIAEVLFGDVDPSGRLPLSFPRAERDLPPFDNVSVEVRYGFLHGYRWLDARGIEPLFPFGFGRSYTTFEYANLGVSRVEIGPQDRLQVTADVTNTGGMAGDEVVQLYVSYHGSNVERAPKDLRAFARVHLEPGETRTVPLELAAAELAYWDVAASTWRVEPIEYGVHVGSSSRDLPLEGRFRIVPAD